MSPLFGAGARVRLIGVAMLVATFMAGGVAGVALQQTVFADEPPPPRQDRNHDDRDRRPRRDPYEGLGLTADQRTRIDSVFARRRVQVDSVWKIYEPVFKNIQMSTRAELDRIFTPEQRTELDRRRDERRAREAQRQQQQQQQRGRPDDPGARGGPKGDGPKGDGPKGDGPKGDGAKGDGPHAAGMHDDWPDPDAPHWDGPKWGAPKWDGPKERRP